MRAPEHQGTRAPVKGRSQEVKLIVEAMEQVLFSLKRLF